MLTRKRRWLTFCCLLFIAVGLHAQCDQYRFNTTLNSNWIGCEESESPNPDRGESLWLLYDLKESRTLGESWLWNINHPEYTNIGVSDYAIDISNNLVDWMTIGDFFIEEANASGYYSGVMGPDFGGVEARYILMTLLDNHSGDECIGLGEWKIESSEYISNIDETSLPQLTVFPNPAYDLIKIKSGTVNGEIRSVIITDNLGRVIYHGSVSSNGEIDVSSWEAGIYFAAISGDYIAEPAKFCVIK